MSNYSPIIHLNYKIDKPYWRDIFWNNKDCGSWHHTCVSEYRRDLYWWRILIDRPRNFNTHLLQFTDPVASDLNIDGLDNYPRLNYYFANNELANHLDPDGMFAILINLEDTMPSIRIEQEEHPYECALVDVGNVMHGISAVPHQRLILKFCLRHPFEEIYQRLDNAGLIDR